MISKEGDDKDSKIQRSFVLLVNSYACMHLYAYVNTKNDFNSIQSCMLFKAAFL